MVAKKSKQYQSQIKKFEKDFIEKIKSEKPEIIDNIQSSGKLEENTEKLLVKTMKFRITSIHGVKVLKVLVQETI